MNLSYIETRVPVYIASVENEDNTSAPIALLLRDDYQSSKTLELILDGMPTDKRYRVSIKALKAAVEAIETAVGV
jgi:hypothetical protein